MSPSLLSMTWISTTRTASNSTPASWKPSPSHENSMAPALASATPPTMTRMFATEPHVGLATPMSTETSRTAAGDEALSIWMKATER